MSKLITIPEDQLLKLIEVGSLFRVYDLKDRVSVDFEIDPRDLLESGMELASDLARNWGNNSNSVVPPYEIEIRDKVEYHVKDYLDSDLQGHVGGFYPDENYSESNDYKPSISEYLSRLEAYFTSKSKNCKAPPISSILSSQVGMLTEIRSSLDSFYPVDKESQEPELQGGTEIRVEALLNQKYLEKVEEGIQLVFTSADKNRTIILKPEVTLNDFSTGSKSSELKEFLFYFKELLALSPVTLIDHNNILSISGFSDPICDSLASKLHRYIKSVDSDTNPLGSVIKSLYEEIDGTTNYFEIGSIDILYYNQKSDCYDIDLSVKLD